MGKRKPRTRVKSDNQPAKPAPQDSGRTRVFKPFFQPILLLAFFVSGATSLSLEVAWSKQLSYLLGVDVYAATTVVTAFMFGLGLGAFLVSKYYRWPRISIKSYGYLQVAIGISGLISIPMLRSTGPLFSFLFVQFQFNTHIFLIMRFLCVFALIVIPIMLMGMTLPIVVGASFGKAQSDYVCLGTYSRRI